METYIRKSIAGYYIEFPEEIDTVYWQGKIGSTYADFMADKWVHLSPEQVAFHKGNPFATIEEVLAMELKAETLEEAKARKIGLIKEYDSSEAVNSFNVESEGGDISAWLTPSERSNYRSSIDAAELVGLTELSLYIGEIPVILSVQSAKMILAQIQLYADQCYIVTKQHIAAVEALETVEEVDAYDFTVGYPERLSFTL